MKDSYLENLSFKASEIEHLYGPQYHILSDPYLLSGLSRLGSEACKQPELHYWVGRLYRSLLAQAVNLSFEKKLLPFTTRMHRYHPAESSFEMKVPNPDVKIVVVNIARAGTVPSYVCYDELNYFFKPEGIRQDHLIMNREVDADGRVTGSVMNASKIGATLKTPMFWCQIPWVPRGRPCSRPLKLTRVAEKPKNGWLCTSS